MTANSIDALWFMAHPERAYRLRRQTEGEVALWPVPLRPGMTAWCIVRRSDGAVEAFASDLPGGWDDGDAELAGFFASLSDHG